MQVRFCPGYHIARQCNRHCADCAHIIVSDIPDYFAPLIPAHRDSDLAPVLGYGRTESLKIIRTGVDAEKALPKPSGILPTGRKPRRIEAAKEVWA